VLNGWDCLSIQISSIMLIYRGGEKDFAVSTKDEFVRVNGDNELLLTREIKNSKEITPERWDM
jgi:hypothetical protein